MAVFFFLYAGGLCFGMHAMFFLMQAVFFFFVCRLVFVSCVGELCPYAFFSLFVCK